MYKPRTSYKQASEAAALLGGIFYGSHEYQPANKKCCVRLDGVDHEFSNYTAALEWMLEECARRDFGEGA